MNLTVNRRSFTDEQLIAACERLLQTEREVLAMEPACSIWFMDKPGHRDCFIVARALRELLTKEVK